MEQKDDRRQAALRGDRNGKLKGKVLKSRLQSHNSRDEKRVEMEQEKRWVECQWGLGLDTMVDR